MLFELPYVTIILFYNVDYEYPGCHHMAIAGGEIKKTTAIACVYTINRCIETGLYLKTTKDTL